METPKIVITQGMEEETSNLTDETMLKLNDTLGKGCCQIIRLVTPGITLNKLKKISE